MPETCLILPTAEPVDLAAAKLHLRETSTAQDLEIATLIGSAREAAEQKTRQQLLHARWQLTLDTFPMAGSGTPLPFADTVNIPPFAIILPHAPVVRVVSIQYYDMNNALQTMDPGDYVLNAALMPAIVTPRFGKIWPIPIPQIGAVVITYDAGYASPFTANASNEQLAVSGPVTWSVDDTVRFYNSGGALPAPLKDKTDYKIASVPVAGAYTLKDTAGNAIDLTDAGSGSSFICTVPRGPVPQGLLNWILLRTASLYQNREEVAILSRGTVGELPFMEGVLDPHRCALPW